MKVLRKSAVLLMAVVAIMSVSCSKDKLEDNMAIYDGATYTLEPIVERYNEGLTMVSAFSKEKNAEGESLFSFQYFHVRADENYSMWNKSYDLSKATDNEEAMIEITFEGEALTMFAGLFHDGCNGRIDGVLYENESPFKSGTVEVTGDNDGSNHVTVELKGELKNGKKISMRIVN